jgi:hypothetical protein
LFTSIEAAAAIGTTPRALRRFLRDNDSWRNAGIGGRYMFTDAELKSLNVQFHKWNKSKPVKVKSEPVEDLDSPGISVEEMLEMPKNPKLRADVLKMRAERMARLTERMRACGVGTRPVYVDELEEAEA